MTDPSTTPRTAVAPTGRRADDIGLVAVTVVAAAVGASASVALTASALSDRLWTIAFTVGLTVCGTRARRPTLVWLAAVATFATIGSIWVTAGLAALMVILLPLRPAPSPRLTGALGALGAAAALLHPPGQESPVFVAAVTLLAAVPVLVSALAASTPTLRRRALLGAALLGSLTIAATALCVVAGITASSSVTNAIDSARAGISATRAGEQQRAAGSFATAEANFTEAGQKLDSIWTIPARIVPLLGANVGAVDSAMTEGRRLASSAHDAILAAPYEQIRLDGTGIDLTQVTSMQGPVSDLARQVQSVQIELAAIDRSWLLPAVSSRLDRLADQISSVEPQLITANDALTVLPSLLGGSAPRTYLVAFTSESESRFLGGFVGSYALLRADNGRLSLERSESVGALNRRLGPDVEYIAPVEFKNLYRGFSPQRYAQNWSVAPDLPSDADMIEQLFAHATGIHVDGVLAIDPVGLAALLKLTGPIRVTGIAQPLTAANAAEYLFHGQYLEFVGQVEQRRDRLAEVAEVAFDELLRSPRTTYRDIADALGPQVTGHHLMFSVFEPSDQAFLDRLGITGRFEDPEDASMFSFRNSASFANKIDYFLHRSFTYDTTIDPVTGQIDTDVTVELRNDAPSRGLPAYVIGNENGEPNGTNGMFLSMYTDLRITSSLLDGEKMGLGRQSDRGMRVYSRGITIPPGGTRVLRLHLRGVAPRTPAGFRLEIPQQPMVNNDQVRFTVRSSDPRQPVTSLLGFPKGEIRVDDGEYTVSTEPVGDLSATITFAGPPR